MKFSVIVPCYKCKDTIERLMNSIVNQNEKDLEVILVNDEEGLRYLPGIAKKYSQYFPVNIVKTDFYNHNPGNSRNYGIETAKGDWILFIDCDDSFREGAFDIFSEAIKVAPDAAMHFAKVKQWHPDGREFSDKEDYLAKHLVWLHGKCYNRKFLNKHNIRFIPNMKSCEDYWFNYLVKAHMLNDGSISTDLNQFVYNWMWNDNSLSRSDEYCMSLMKHFYDHIKASLIPWISVENTDKSVNIQEVYSMFKTHLVLEYFVYQHFKTKGIYYATDIIREALSKTKIVFGLSITDIINDVESNYDWYNEIFNISVKSFTREKFVCQESFRTWILNICK